VTASTADAARVTAPARTGVIGATHALVDCLFLAVVTGVSMVTYVGGLGFYYDDYSVLYRMAFSSDQSLVGLYDSVRPATGQRPLQAFIFATLYRLFGLEPLGYHLVNAGMLVAIAMLLYLVMRELRLPRLLCVGIPLVYSILPHYATNRFWVNAFQINLSGLFYLLSLYAALRALRARPIPLAGWLTVAFASVAGSLFAYEVIFPLFALNVGLVWWAARRLREEEGRGDSARIVVGGLAAVILAVGIVKLVRVAEHGQNAYEVGFQDGFLHHIAYLVSGGIKLNLGTYFVAVPYVLWWIVRHAFGLADAAAAVAAGLLAFGYVWWIGQKDPRALAGGRHWRQPRECRRSAGCGRVSRRGDGLACVSPDGRAAPDFLLRRHRLCCRNRSSHHRHAQLLLDGRGGQAGHDRGGPPAHGAAAAAIEHRRLGRHLPGDRTGCRLCRPVGFPGRAPARL
jgi:hypothetical protein